MEPFADNPPLIVILGPTASGKTALALELAERYRGEIIAADSRTIYKGMDIGTAKPSAAERTRVPHHLLDVAMPNQPFSVADFQKLANAAIDDIARRGNVPFLVGGSGLYIDAVIYNFTFRAAPRDSERQLLQDLRVDELQQLIVDRGLALPENRHNPRHLIRVLETNGQVPKRTQLRPRTLLLGLDPGRDALRQKIVRRVDLMVEQGFITEVRQLAQQYGWNAPALMAPGYRAFRSYLEGVISLDEAKQQFVQNDMQYAKRQQTWFKRNADIHWISKTAEAVELITTLLNN